MVLQVPLLITRRLKRGHEEKLQDEQVCGAVRWGHAHRRVIPRYEALCECISAP